MVPCNVTQSTYIGSIYHNNIYTSSSIMIQSICHIQWINLEKKTHIPTHKYRKKYSKINQSLAYNPGMEEYTIPTQETPYAPYSAVVYKGVNIPLDIISKWAVNM